MELKEAGPHAGFGVGGKPEFRIGPGQATTAGTHVAFAAPDRAAVRAFHPSRARGRRARQRPARLRPQYHPTYYGAFVLDPDGHNVEAVRHRPR